MRVVFDTNVFVSALIFLGGQAQAALLQVIEGRDRLIVSKAIIDELLYVLARKFSKEREELARVAVLLTELGERVRPRRKIRILSDDPDNRILKCAVAGRADAIVTGDQAMLNLGRFQGIRIITLSEYLKMP